MSEGPIGRSWYRDGYLIEPLAEGRVRISYTASNREPAPILRRVYQREKAALKSIERLLSPGYCLCGHAKEPHLAPNPDYKAQLDAYMNTPRRRRAFPADRLPAPCTACPPSRAEHPFTLYDDQIHAVFRAHAELEAEWQAAADTKPN